MKITCEHCKLKQEVLNLNKFIYPVYCKNCGKEIKKVVADAKE